MTYSALTSYEKTFKIYTASWDISEMFALQGEYLSLISRTHIKKKNSEGSIAFVILVAVRTDFWSSLAA